MLYEKATPSSGAVIKKSIWLRVSPMTEKPMKTLSFSMRCRAFVRSVLGGTEMVSVFAVALFITRLKMSTKHDIRRIHFSRITNQDQVLCVRLENIVNLKSTRKMVKMLA